MVPGDDRVIGAIDCSHAALEGIRWSDCKFRSDANFTAASFTGEVDMRGARFERRAGFSRARFHCPVYLSGASFRHDGHFWQAHFGDIAIFEETTHVGDADFSDTIFNSAGRFNGTAFRGTTNFYGASFDAEAEFRQCVFGRDAIFDNSKIDRHAKFEQCGFDGTLSFKNSVIGLQAQFGQCRFDRDVSFTGSTIKSDAIFFRSYFAGDAGFDGVITDCLNLSLSTFSGRSHELSVAPTSDGQPYAEKIVLWMLRARIESDTVVVLGENCHLDASRLVVRAPLTVVAMRPDCPGSLISVLDADITAPFRVGRHIDLSGTTFGDHDLTTMTLASTDTLPRTSVVRALLGRKAVPPWVFRLPQGRRILKADLCAEGSSPDLHTLERNYRDLRRQLEASGNTHGANDFYFGEMEARRRRLPRASPRRWLLWLYRVSSGYGTMAWPTIVWWQIIVVVATFLLLLNGIDITEDRSYSWSEVWRFALEGSLSLFRPTTAPLLSLPETIIMVILRILGPVLLALAAIAVRNQTKR